MSYFPVLSPFIAGPCSPCFASGYSPFFPAPYAPFAGPCGLGAPVTPLLVARFGQLPSSPTGPRIPGLGGRGPGRFEPGGNQQVEIPFVAREACTATTCFLFPVPLYPQGPDVADFNRADRVPRGTVLRVTRTATPPGWAEVIVDLPSSPSARRYIRTADFFVAPSGGAAGGGGGGAAGGGGATDPELTQTAEPGSFAGKSTVSKIGEAVLLTAPAWGSFLLTRFLR